MLVHDSVAILSEIKIICFVHKLEHFTTGCFVYWWTV